MHHYSSWFTHHALREVMSRIDLATFSESRLGMQGAKTLVKDRSDAQSGGTNTQNG
jgi:hypothetical protein